MQYSRFTGYGYTCGVIGCNRWGRNFFFVYLVCTKSRLCGGVLVVSVPRMCSVRRRRGSSCETGQVVFLVTFCNGICWRVLIGYAFLHGGM